MHPGQKIAHYEIVAQLGRGGMGVVYKAVDTKLDRTVALKFLSRELSDNEDAKERFIREAKSASALDHANICTIHDIAETDDGELYIVMAHYEGETLKYRLENEDFSIDRATNISRQIARALERAHEANIIHRDIKPANVMVSNRDEVKLLDFGLAKLTTGLDLTREGSTVGTAAYMSPEQARGEEVSAATDVWALGVVTYELLAGRKPFGGAYEQAMIYGILNEDPTPLDEIRPEIPERLVNAVHKALAKNAEERFPGAGAFLEALEGRSDQPQLSAASPAVTGGRAAWFAARTRALVLGTAAVFVAVALLALGTWLAKKPVGNAVVATDRFAVMPFTVRGSPDVQYLGEGIVSLISDKLDGAGSLTAVDPRAVIALINDRELKATDPEAGAVVAATFGAGKFITGDVVQAGGKVNISASLHVGRGATAPIHRATREGPEANVLELIDDLATELLAGSLTGAEARLQKAATLTSATLPAAREFLKGEKYLREGLYRDAAAAYDRAVELDSSFALAYFRKSLAGDWIDAPDRTTTAEKAVTLAGALSPRDRLLVETLRDQRIGLRRKAKQQYRSYLTQFPDEVEPQTQLAELIFHDNPRRGEPVEEARAPYERVLQLEPTNVIAQVHLARMDALNRDDSLLTVRATFFRDIDFTPERAIEVDALYAYSVGDTVRQRDIKRRLATGEWYFYAYAAHGVAKFLHDPYAAFDLFESRRDQEAALESMIPEFSLMAGKYRDASSFFLDHRREGGSWTTYTGFAVTSGLIHASDGELEMLLQQVRAANPEDIIRTSFLAPHDDFTPAVAEFERDWTEAMILLELDRPGEARAIYNGLKADTVQFHGLGTTKQDNLVGLLGLIQYQEGSTEEALESFRSIVFDTPHFITWRPFVEQTRSRFLLAQLEREAGNNERAESILRGFLESWSPYDGWYIPDAYVNLGEIAVDENRIDDAIRYYSRFIEMWRDCDAELVARRDEIQRRRDELMVRQAGEPSRRI